jgi:hypothetical protein
LFIGRREASHAVHRIDDLSCFRRHGRDFTVEIGPEFFDWISMINITIEY